MDWKEHGNEVKAYRESNIGELTLSRLLKSCEIETEEDWLPLFVEHGIDDIEESVPQKPPAYPTPEQFKDCEA